ncbi:glycosyltransferase family 2 protein [Hymenobacter bucti]|uniref:Glycosyltransferase family 2 protein n=1 Tax=Hymenobacter bucti TaxID=1844114 RepID=A0ABW4QTU0_9BACT
MQQPLVSVITAFLNEERFLPEAIASVLAQDYPHWELVLVDDGSTDRSTALAQQYAAQHPGKIRYCEHPGHANKGLSASRNHGIAAAQGQLLAFLDADDVWLPGKLTQQVGIFGQHPDVGMVAEASLYWHQWHPSDQADELILVGAPGERVYQPTELLRLLYPLGAGAAPCPSGLMLTRQACQAVGGFEASFTGRYQLYEDQAFLSKIYSQQKVYISSACHNRYRQRLGSIVQEVKEQGHYHAVRRHFLEWLLAYLHRENSPSQEVTKLVRKALRPYHHPVIHRLAGLTLRRLASGIVRRARG